MEMKEIAVKEPVHLDNYDIDVQPYLTSGQIQSIATAVSQFDEWKDREQAVDMMLLYYVTNMSKEKIEEIGHDKLLCSGLIDEVKINVLNFWQIYKAVDYTESFNRMLIQISKKMPDLMAKLEKNVK
nr:MAG TPA: hypothetical protein [Caudoviricetes sp.]